MIVHFVVLFVLLFCSSWLKTMETALISINPNKLRLMVEGGNEKVAPLAAFTKSLTPVLTSLRFGWNIFSVAFCCYGALYLQGMTIALLEQIGFLENIRFLGAISFFVLLFILVGFLFVFAQMVPERLGMYFAENAAVKALSKVRGIHGVLAPFSSFFRSCANGIVKLFGIDPHTMDANVTEEEIRMLVDAGGEDGSIDENEKEMINNIFEFDNTTAGEIATHRMDIVALPLFAKVDEVIEMINEEKYTRIPVYDESIDDIVGILHVKDMMKFILNTKEDAREDGFSLQDIMMKPYFVPFSKKTDDLFREMQQEKIHMAIIIDEYGGTAGIVTMEDILEEIVGNIFDEYDIEEEEEIRYVDEDHFLINGTTDLSDVEELLGLEFTEDEDYDTLGGYLIGQLGRIPEDGETPEVVLLGHIFKIEKIEEKRIETIRVSKVSKVS